MHSFPDEINLDNIIWNVLTMWGMNIFKSTSKTMSYISQVMVVFLHISILHMTCLNLIHVVKFGDKLYASMLLQNLVSFFLWCQLRMKRKQIYSILVQIYTTRKLLNIPNGKFSLFINVALVTTVLIVLAEISIDIFSLITTDDNFQEFWTFDCKITNRSLRNFLFVFGPYSYFTFLCFIPALVLLSLSTIEYRCGDILIAINGDLKKLLEKKDPNDAVYLIKLFFKVYDMLEEVKELLSFPLLLLITCNFLMLLTGLLLYLVYENRSHEIVIEMALVLLVGCFSILSQGIWGPLIPETLAEIKKMAGKIVEKNKRDPFVDNYCLYYFERIEKSDIVCLTGYGMFDIKRNFIVNAFGAILTYGLLIINQK